MFNRFLLTAGALLSLAAAPAFAASTFQNTCSEIHFAYRNRDATIQAVCLKVDGSPNPTSLVLRGISNDNGKLSYRNEPGTLSGLTTFQKSCGNIQIVVNEAEVTLSAICRMSNGSSVPTSLPLDNIANNNGHLVQD